jgi:hypothetical protein
LVGGGHLGYPSRCSRGHGFLVDDSFFSRSDAWAAGLADVNHIERFAASVEETTGDGGKQA